MLTMADQTSVLLLTSLGGCGWSSVVCVAMYMYMWRDLMGISGNQLALCCELAIVLYYSHW